MSAGCDGDLVTVGMLRDVERGAFKRIAVLEEKLGPKVGREPEGDPDEADYRPTFGSTGPFRRLDEDDPWANRSKAMSCSTCMWFMRKAKSGPQPSTAREVGRCRRHAPTMAGYPVVFEVDWCGDHKLDENKA